MLCEAQELVKNRDQRDLVCPNRLKEWGNDARFTASCESPECIQINGHVKGGDAMTRKDQEAFLQRKGLEQAQLEDLAAAFVAHYVAKGQDLFDDKWVRAVGGALRFYSIGLVVSVNAFGDAYSGSDVAVASRVRPELKKTR